MIEHNVQDNQIPKELKSVFDKLETFKHLRRTGIKKNFEFTRSFLFQLVFYFIFHHKTQTPTRLVVYSMNSVMK